MSTVYYDIRMLTLASHLIGEKSYFEVLLDIVTLHFNKILLKRVPLYLIIYKKIKPFA